MTKTLQISLVIPGIFLFVLICAMFPVVLQADPQGTLHFHWTNGFLSMREYFEGLWNGQSFLYSDGRKELSYWEQIGRSFKVSFFYTGIGAIAGTAAGILLGIRLAVARSERLNRVLDMTNALPDFIFVLLLQFAIVFIFLNTGLLLFEVASTSTDEPAIALPLISAIVIPANYLIQNVRVQMKHTLTEDYISFAKAKGLRAGYIIFFHALPNVLPYIKADLHKYMGILFGNLFIFEYLFNLYGVTRFTFTNVFAYEGYQYPLVVNGILALMVLYAIVYALLRLFLYGCEKVFIR